MPYRRRVCSDSGLLGQRKHLMAGKQEYSQAAAPSTAGPGNAWSSGDAAL